jgi:hypothetical protein
VRGGSCDVYRGLDAVDDVGVDVCEGLDCGILLIVRYKILDNYVKG